MDVMLQIWGRSFYLVNKVFFAFAESQHHQTKRRLKAIGWLVYILGAPSWVVILIGKNNWIAASIEVGGVPAMMFGFLLGSYLMAKGNHNGWLFLMLMNISMAALMLLQSKLIFMSQQLLSLCFVIYGFRIFSRLLSDKG